MKKDFKKLVFTLFFISFSLPLYASVWSAWADEDEELNAKENSSKKSLSSNKSNSSLSSLRSLWNNEDEEKKVQKQISNEPEVPVSSVSAMAPAISNQDLYAVPSYSFRDEDNINTNEVYNSINKWKDGLVSVFWENYRGNNVRIEMLKSNKDLKEMRLKFVQSQNMISDPDASISDMLNNVANQVMRRTCGKKAKQSIILYERPAIEIDRETVADEYRVMAKGTSIKEYGFRCIY